MAVNLTAHDFVFKGDLRIYFAECISKSVMVETQGAVISSSKNSESSAHRGIVIGIYGKYSKS